ncbi:cytochrome P450 [Pararhodobacter sp.]|uniref:cytochrome P450 n=1 Tax=Pararhodobacter sp. TaxID=2127056 RepID=UPI002AFE3E91|nr:cytochrome P450 [Pararhodobacter sp.]
MPLAPIDTEITIAELTRSPYPIYQRLRAQTPVLKVASVGRTFLTKAADTRAVKENPELWSSNDPNTPMERAFQAHTLMRKDGEAHLRARNAMLPTFSARNIRTIWSVEYEKLAAQYLDRLPRDEVIDLFSALAGPLAARILSVVLGIPEASDYELQEWSQALIDGAGNFGWAPEPFARVDRAHIGMNALLKQKAEVLKAAPNQSALSVMVNAEDPLDWDQIVSNIKIAIGGGINEPRDALLTCVVGLVNNPDQLEAIKESGKWGDAFEEAVRWVAPIQVSARVATSDTEIRGIDIPKGDVVLTCQASSNHDEELFEDGHEYNVFRKHAPHQSFGGGPHHCMGTHISRAMIGKIMLPMLFERFPNMKLMSPNDVNWSGFGFRGPLSLPVRLT